MQGSRLCLQHASGCEACMCPNLAHVRDGTVVRPGVSCCGYKVCRHAVIVPHSRAVCNSSVAHTAPKRCDGFVGCPASGWPGLQVQAVCAVALCALWGETCVCMGV
jgi:hypothetical protein